MTKPETINYRTLKPEKDGLFCERIFGPTKDWECYCGKYKRVRYKGIVCERCGVEVTRSKVRRERMGHIDLAAPVSHIWFFKGVPSRIGYLLDIAPKELEKVLYFAASIVTWIDEEARAKDLDEAREGGQEGRRRLRGARSEERIQELRESLERRLEYLETGKQTGFNDEDHLWADALEVNIKKLSDADREKLEKDLRKAFDQDIDDTEAYIDDAAERTRQAWEKFQDMKVKEVIADEALFRELKDRFGSPFGWGEYFRGGMGAEAVRDLLEQVDLDAEADGARAHHQELQGPEAEQGDQAPEGRVRLPQLEEPARVDDPRGRPGDPAGAAPDGPARRRPVRDVGPERPLPARDQPQQPPQAAARPRRARDHRQQREAHAPGGRRRAVRQRPPRPARDRARATARSSRCRDMLKGKQGRFRQNLLGKRVDYSGRSVIVAGPNLKLHQCGLPKLMALELFKPFIMARLVERKAVQNIKAAKKMVESMIPEVWDVLEEVIHEHPVLLNRAPTLHRLGIQAFEPVLVEGKAIQIHPLVCHAFNADFDGDQMAVHVPLSAEAQAEARILMLSANNILSPAHGGPLATPTQDMVLGVYYLTYGPEPEELEEMDPNKVEAAAARVPHRAGGRARLRGQAGAAPGHRDLPARRRATTSRPRSAGSCSTTGSSGRSPRRSATSSSPREHEFINQTLTKREISTLVVDARGRATARPRSRWCSTPSRTSASTTRARPGSRSPRTTS